MRDTDEVLVGALEYFCTTLFAQLLPVAKQKIDGIAIICIFESHKVIVTLEDNTRIGGYGSAVAELLEDFGLTDKRLFRFGLPDHFVEQGEIKELYKLLKIDGESVARQLMEKL